MTKPRRIGPATAWGTLRIVLYVVVLLSPLLLVTALRPHPTSSFVYTLGLHAGLAGIAILALQVLLSARLRWLEWPFGLDQLIRFHKAMAIFGSLLVLAHPVLLAWGSGRWTLLSSWRQPWYIWFGRAALLLLVATVLVSWFRQRIKFEFQSWRLVHNVLAVSLLSLAFLHSIVAGRDLEHPVMRIIWPLAGVAIGAVYVFHKFLRPAWLRRKRYHVAEVIRENEDVTTVKLRPPPGRPCFDYLPGQFHFVTFHAGDPTVPTEEHHWTIASSPTQRGTLASTIKASGDFTANIHKLQVGDQAEVLGPFGRFSYSLHPQQDDIVMIAGGIGITPLMAMLRHMRDVRATKRVLLLYANRTESDIVFRQKLDTLVGGEHPQLTLVHVLSHPDDSWQGPRGHVDRELIREHCNAPTEKAFFVCGPPAMADAVTSTLLGMGILQSQIHGERFSL